MNDFRLKILSRTIYPNYSYRTTLITCSIFPELARVWWYFAKRYINHRHVRVVIADSSGEMSPADFDGAAVIRFPNYHHGKKMDIFIRDIVRTPYVFFCDDDTFIIHRDLEETGFRYLQNERKAVVYTFNPRDIRARIKNKPVKLMGGSCIMLDRKIIKELGITFEEKKCRLPYETNKNFDLYDTGDYLSYMLPQKGYSIYFRKKNEKPQLIFPFIEGVSVAYNWYNTFKNNPKWINNILNYKKSSIIYAYRGLFARYIIGRLYTLLFHTKPDSARILTKGEFNTCLGYLKRNISLFKEINKILKRLEINILKFIKKYK